MENNYKALMEDGGELISVTQEMVLETGTLIGFRGISSKKSLSAIYPIWRKKANDKEIQFVLGIAKDTNRPIVDNTWVRDYISEFTAWVNDPPVIIKVNTSNPQSLQDRFFEVMPPIPNDFKPTQQNGK